MSQCGYHQEQISRLIDEDLSAPERAELEEHLKTCPDCAAMFEAFARISRGIGGELEEAPLDMRENIMAQIRREELRRRERLPSIWRTVIGVAAAVAVVAGVTLGVSPTLRDRLAARATGAETPMMAAQAVYEEAAQDLDESVVTSNKAVAGAGEALPEEAEDEAAVTFDLTAPESAEPESAAELQSATAGPDSDAALSRDASESDGGAMPEAAAESADTAESDGGAAADDAAETPAEAVEEEPAVEVERRDLTGWLELSSLRALLGAGETDLDRAALQRDAKLELLVRHAGESCAVPLYAHEGELYWYDPVADAVYRSDLSWQKLQDFLG